MVKVQEKGRVVKTTQKKKYILNALNPAHLRVASIYVVVLDMEAADMRATVMSENSTTSSNQFNSTLTKLQNAQAKPKAGDVRNREQIKALRMRNNSTMNSKGGYDSEGEVKSTNSTTTSSTLQFIPTRNFDPATNATIAPTKSSRSLS